MKTIFSTAIREEWLDYNNHVNVAAYVQIFDLAGEALITELGMGEAMTRETGISWAVLENHITYDNEVVLGQQVEVRVQLVDHDHKRLHLYYEMHVTGDSGYLASTLEQMLMCIDLGKRKSASFPESTMKIINQWAEEHYRLQRPETLGRTIGIRR